MISSIHVQQFRTSLALASLFVVFCSFASIPAFAEEKIIRDSKGTEFWLTFLPNYHNPSDMGGNIREDSLYIYITAEQIATGTIEFDSAGVQKKRDFSIQKDDFFTLRVPFNGCELVGYSSPSSISPSGLSENQSAVHRCFHVISNTEVTVYGLNKARTTSDAFIALPQDVLGQEYMVCSYPSDGDTPSEFAIVATKDNTQITIRPSGPTSIGGSDESSAIQTPVLNAGEVYLVQAPQGTVDLTGTTVSANQPIAVFAGHQRATIPGGIPDLISRDHLVEQLNPIPTWGGSAFVTPYPLAFNGSSLGFDQYRVLAAYDNTKVYVDGIFNRTLKAGESYIAPLTKSEWVTATGPITVAQYKKTSQENGVPGTGDPFMIINSPTEQYLKRFHCFNIQVFKNNNDVYGNEQYLTIIVPTDSVATVKLDGKLIDPSKFKPLSITSYSYTDSMHVTSGAHTVESNVEMGVYVYGYGDADSYGYIGGMKYDTIYKFDPPDIIPPQIAGKMTCDSLVGAVYDTLAFDRGLKSVESIPGSVKNVDLSIGAIKAPGRSVQFFARLQDPYQDGEFIISTRDSANKTRKQTFPIPGFTVRAATSVSGEAPLVTGRTNINETLCFTVDITNYGKFDQTIDNRTFTLGSKQYTVKTPLPFTLTPGSTRPIEICFTADHVGLFIDTLVLSNACANRQVVALKHFTDGLLSSSKTVECSTLRGKFYDTAAFRLNMTKVDTVAGSMHNINSLLIAFTPGEDSISFTAQLKDPYQDGSGRIEARNDEGVRGWIDFDIPGFTVHPDPINFQIISQVADVRADRKTCAPVNMTNYGKFPQTFTLTNSLPEYTVSPSSLTLQPGSTASVQVCFQPTTTGTFTDSLIIGNLCVQRKIASFALTAIRDNHLPSITGTSDQCAHTNHIAVRDDLGFDWGIESYAVLEKTNCTLTEDPSGLPGVVAFDAQVLNPRADARYHVQVTDSAGNVRDTTVILQGFTLSFTNLQQQVYSFAGAFREEILCDSVEVYNASELPFVIEDAQLFQNVNFSIPLSQFPVTIAPKDTGTLLVCFSPKEDQSYNDTLRLAKYCIEEIIQTAGKKSDILLSAGTRCSVNVRLSSSAKPTKAFLEQSYPNPAADLATIRFGLPADQHVQIRLYNALGNVMTITADRKYAAGIYELEVETSRLENGLYFYELMSGDERIVKTMHIVR